MSPRKPAEGFVLTPKGGQAARCTAKSKGSGKRCAKPARAGFSVCSTHGAGTRKREETGSRNRVGGAVTTGRYATTPLSTFAAMQDEVAEMEGALESTDADLLVLKGLVRLVLTQLETHLSKLEIFEEVGDQLESLLASGDLEARDVKSAENGLRDARRVTTDFTRLVREASDVTTKTVSAHLIRATTAARLAEQKGTEVFVELCQTQRAIVAELAPDVNWLDNYEAALRRQIFGVKRLELPQELPPLEHPIDDLVVAVKAEPIR